MSGGGNEIINVNVMMAQNFFSYFLPEYKPITEQLITGNLQEDKPTEDAMKATEDAITAMFSHLKTDGVN